jgi:hypothetical protein
MTTERLDPRIEALIDARIQARMDAEFAATKEKLEKFQLEISAKLMESVERVALDALADLAVQNNIKVRIFFFFFDSNIVEKKKKKKSIAIAIEKKFTHTPHTFPVKKKKKKKKNRFFIVFSHLQQRFEMH